jgi:hypothetical protein
MTQHESIRMTIEARPPLITGQVSPVFNLTELCDTPDIEKGANGGDLSADFGFSATAIELDDWLENGLGKDITIYKPDGGVYWNGFVNSIMADYGPRSVTRGELLSIVNKLKVIYTATPITLIYPPPTLGKTYTTIVEDLPSQEKYGIIEGVYNAGEQTLLVATQIGQMILESMREPVTAKKISYESSSTPKLTLNCLGYVYWLETYRYNNANTGATTPTARIQAVLTACPNAIYSTQYDLMETNAFAIAMRDEEDKTAKQVVEGCTMIGDPTDYSRWLFEIVYPRKCIFKKIPATIYANYYINNFGHVLIDPATQSEIRPWNVIPGNWVLHADFMVGKLVTLDDLPVNANVGFLEGVSFSPPYNITFQGSRILKINQKLAQLGLESIGFGDEGSVIKVRKGGWKKPPPPPEPDKPGGWRE